MTEPDRVRKTQRERERERERQRDRDGDGEIDRQSDCGGSWVVLLNISIIANVIIDRTAC